MHVCVCMYIIICIYCMYMYIKIIFMYVNAIHACILTYTGARHIPTFYNNYVIVDKEGQLTYLMHTYLRTYVHTCI